MSRLSQRCARIIRVRSVEHSVAAARMAAADRRVGELLGVARRIGDLRTSLRPELGSTNGQILQAMADMQRRLERAECDLAHPIRQAADKRDQASADRLLARTKEDGASRLRDKAVVRQEAAAVLRSQADQPFRQIKRRLP